MPELESLEIQRLNQNRAEIPGTGALAIAPQQPDTQRKISAMVDTDLCSPDLSCNPSNLGCNFWKEMFQLHAQEFPASSFK